MQKKISELVNEFNSDIQIGLSDDQVVVNRKKYGKNILEEKKKTPLIVGGSGLYVDALITNYDLSAEKRSDSNEDKYQELSNEELYNKLYSLNPDAALKTHPAQTSLHAPLSRQYPNN